MVGGDYVQSHTNPAKFGPFGIGGRAPARGEIYGWCDFVSFFYSSTRAQTKRGSLDECKMAQNTRIRVHMNLLGVKILRTNFWGAFDPKNPKNQKPPKLGSE